MLRSSAMAAVAADPAAREELRRLGYGDVSAAPADALDEALDEVAPDPSTSANIERHPGPRIVVAGPVTPSRSLELVIDAFGDLIASDRPSATLSICGPSTPWYMTVLRRRVLTGGLLACELVRPDDDSQLAARLDHATAVVALRPQGLGPYLRRAARAGAAIVAPIDATTLRYSQERLVRLPARVSREALGEAMAAATGTSTAAARPSEPTPTSGQSIDALLRALRIG